MGETLAQGLTLSYYSTPGTPTTGSYTQIGEITSLTIPGATRTVLDTTVLDQADNYKTFIGGMKELGEVTFDVLFDPADTDMSAISGKGETATDSEPLETLKIVYNDGSTTTRYIQGFFSADPTISAAPDELLTASISFKVSGKILTNNPEA